jgi:hypothetical protein
VEKWGVPEIIAYLRWSQGMLISEMPCSEDVTLSKALTEFF